MADEAEPQKIQRKAGLLGRMFGRAPQPEPPAPEKATDVPEPSAEPARREEAAGDAALTTHDAQAASAAAQETGPSAAEPPGEKRNWWRRLRDGLSRSSASIGQNIADMFSKRKLDAQTLDELEDALLRADLGLSAAGRIRDAVAKGRFDKGLEPTELRTILAQEIQDALEDAARPLVIDPARRPFVILVVGVNGSGKTTTIGKLAAKFVAEGRSVVLAAGDTFRAAAIEQLQIWGDRVGAEVVARPQGADPAGLAFDALKRAREKGADVLLIDTAGRLHNRSELMAELQKVVTVLKKQDPDAPHAALLVLDATIGQNALNQVEAFGKTAGVTGLVMTKLDGTARGGILVAVADRFKLPIHYVGVGETVEDLEPFQARDFARAIAGLEQAAPERTA